MKKFVTILFLTVAVAGFAQEASTKESQTESGVSWMTFEEAVERSKVEKRKIFIDVYTDWCGWCKVMDRETFAEPEVAKMLNEQFYAVKFNAEKKKEDILFRGTTFKYVEVSPGKGIHQFAAALLQNQMSYPTVVFLSEDFEMIAPVAGYRKAPEFHVTLSYLGSDAFKRMTIDQFVKTEYKSPYSPQTPAKSSGDGD